MSAQALQTALFCLNHFSWKRWNRCILTDGNSNTSTSILSCLWFQASLSIDIKDDIYSCQIISNSFQLIPQLATINTKCSEHLVVGSYSRTLLHPTLSFQQLVVHQKECRSHPDISRNQICSCIFLIYCIPILMQDKNGFVGKKAFEITLR